MFGMPLELITGLISLILGAVLKLWSQAQQDKADQQKALIERFKESEDSVQAAREFNPPSAQWTRRFMVISFMGMAAFILTAPVWGFKTVVPVEVTSGFKWLFFDFTNKATEYVTLDGMVTPEWLPHAIMATVFFYFGQSAVNRK